MPAMGKPGNKQNVPARWVHLTYCYRRVVIERLRLGFTQLEDSSVKLFAAGQLLNCTAKQRCEPKGSGHI